MDSTTATGERRRKVHILVPLLFVVLVALTGVGLILTHGATANTLAAIGTPSPTSGPKLSHGLVVDYAFGYGDLKQLKHDADAAIIGTIIGQAGTGMDAQMSFAYTNWTVRIATLVFDRYHVLTEVKSIVIRQLGGTVNGEQYYFDNDPALRVGDRALFFLRAANRLSAEAPAKSVTPTAPAPYYSTVGDAMGRFQIVNGKITGNIVKTITFAKPLTEAELASQIQSLPA